MKDMFQRLKSGGRSGTDFLRPRLALAAFGKHPGWDDHLPGIGVETEALAKVKQTLYVGGIGGQVDAGAWERLEPEKRVVGFDHTFLWVRAGRVLLGQLWSSQDGKGRTKYPMVLCLDGEALPAGFMLGTLMPGLESLREACRNARTADQVTNACRIAQEELRRILSPGGAPLTASPLPAEVKSRFVESPELGPDRLGWLRVLHDLSAIPAAMPSSGANLRSHSLRVPAAETSPDRALLLWSTFLRGIIPEPVPLWLIARAGISWLDVIVGEPEPDDFFCLQASPKACPLATEIPYQLAPDIRQRWQRIEASFLGIQPPPPAPLSPSPPSSAPAAPQRAPPSAPASPAGRPSGGSKFPLLAIGGVIVVLGIAAAWLLGGGGAAYPVSTVGTTSVPVAVTAPEPARDSNVVAAVPPPVDPAETERAKKLELAVAAARQDQEYQAALAATRTAWERKDYSNAIAQANLALEAKPGDATAAKIVADARQLLAEAAASPPKTSPMASSAGKPPFTNSLGMEFVWVSSIRPAGAYVSKYEVTRDQYLAVMKSLPPGVPGTLAGQVPVYDVGFEEARRFCKLLSEQEHRNYALPSRQEWLAAAGLSEDEVPGAWDLLKRRGWLGKAVTACDTTLQAPAIVGSHGALESGLCDVFGNVREWVVEEQSAGFSFRSNGGGRHALLFLPDLSWRVSETGVRCILRPDPSPE